MNPRKRKMVRDGRMQKMIDEEQKSSPQKTESVLQKPENKEKLLVEEPIVKNEAKEKAIDPFIAKELEEIKRIPSSKKKTVKKKTTTKKTTTKKTTAKKKTGGK